MATLDRLVALLSLVFSLSLAQSGFGQTPALTVFYTAPVVSMAPMWIAKEAGFFKKHGLDVRLVFIASGPVGTTSLIAGETDVGVIGGFAPMRAIAGGAKELTIIGQSKTLMVGSIVGRNDIANVRELKGKRLGIDRIGSNPDMYTMAALARFQMDPMRDLQYIQMGTTSQGIAGLKAGAVDAFTTTPPYDLIALRLGYRTILDITTLKIPFAATVLLSTRNAVTRKPADLAKFMRAYAEAVHYFLTNPAGTAKIVAHYTKVEDREVIAYAVEAEAKAMERTLQVDPKGIELILGLIGKSVSPGATARPQDFYDSRFSAELKDSGFLKRLWGETL
jgi:NitT/TauT family transport system substrate-binding protein